MKQLGTISKIARQFKQIIKLFISFIFNMQSLTSNTVYYLFTQSVETFVEKVGCPIPRKVEGVYEFVY